MSGGAPVWMNAASISAPVDSVFGRTGDIIALS
jgi:hypothetical protein